MDSPAQAQGKSEAAANDASQPPGRLLRAWEPALPEDDEVRPPDDDDAVVLSREDAEPASDDEGLADMSSPNGPGSRGEPAPATSPPARPAAAAQPDEAQPDEAQPDEAQPDEAQLEEAQLEEAQLEEAQLEEAQLEEAQLEEAQLEEAQLEEAQLADSATEAMAPRGATIPAGPPSGHAAAGGRDLAPGGRTDPDPTGRWHEIQAAFVDDPRRSVELAAGLTDDSASALVTAVQDRLTTLQSAWQGGDDDTEQLRSVLREYRDLWMRLGEFSVSA